MRTVRCWSVPCDSYPPLTDLTSCGAAGMTSALRSAPDDLERNHRHIDSSSLRQLPVALSHPVAAAVDTDAACVCRPGLVIDLVTTSEQTFNQPVPMARCLTGTTQASSLDALVNLVGRLPQLADATSHEVIALLGGLSRWRQAMRRDMATRLPEVVRRPHQPS
jgi:hypothetical protein